MPNVCVAEKCMLSGVHGLSGAFSGVCRVQNVGVQAILVSLGLCLSL